MINLHSVITLQINFCIFLLGATAFQIANGGSLDNSMSDIIQYRSRSQNTTSFEGCQFPNHPLHGKYVLINHLTPGYNPGDIVPVYALLSVNCDAGYQGDPPENDYPVYCLDSEQWTSTPRKCSSKSSISDGCRLPNNPPHGKFVVINHLTSGYNPGETVPVYGLLSVTCNPGYEVDPPENDYPSFCFHSGEWIPAVKTCKRTELLSKECQLPSNPPHGEYKVVSQISSGYNHSFLSVTCDVGYEINPLEDNHPSHCLPSGEWTPVPKTCTRTPIVIEGCSLPNNPSHGEYVVINHLSSRYNPGDIVPVYGLLSVTCDTAYEVNPPEFDYSSYCLHSGEWIPAPKTCKRTSLPSEGCRLPHNPSHGKYEVINYSSSRYNPEDIVPVYGLLSATCDAGYEVNPPENDYPSYCIHSGQWTPDPKTCKRTSFLKEGCRFPNNPSHGEYILINRLSSEYHPGDIVPSYTILIVKCHIGYEVKPVEDNYPSYCLNSGEWSPSPKTCTLLRSEGCRLPENPSHGEYEVTNHLSSRHHPGDIVPVYGLLSVTCNEGYEVNPPGNNYLLYCIHSGEWTPAPKTCKRTSYIEGCRLPNNPARGKYLVVNQISSGYNPGDIVPVYSLLSVTCNTGFEVNSLENGYMSHCLHSGEWAPTPKTCESTSLRRKGCRLPNNPSHGEFILINRLLSGFNPGDIVPVYDILFVKCHIGYEVNPTEDNYPSYCLNSGEWIPSPKTCTPTVLQSKGCHFPENRLHGEYMVISSSSSGYNPGDIVPVHGFLFVKCNNGYAVFPPSEDDEPSYCLNSGQWDPAPKICEHIILEGCSTLNSTKSTNVECELNGSRLDSCSDVAENTVARFSCTSLYEEFVMEQNVTTRLCKNGSWDGPIPQCHPICGKRRITDGVVGTPGDYPWQVGVYDSQRKYICGGSLIDQRIVLSGSLFYISVRKAEPPANCFTDIDGKTNPKENYFIAAGKHYSKYSDKRDIKTAQYSNVDAIHVREKFQGQRNSYVANIAVIILSNPFQLSENVQTVCIDLEIEYDIFPSTYGIVTGWGFNNEQRSVELQKQEVIYTTNDKCLEGVEKSFRRYITYDKICVEYQDNGTSLCKDVSGAALVFSEDSSNRYFIKGVQSINTILTENTSCASNSYEIYTSISKHIDFIRDIVVLNRVT